MKRRKLDFTKDFLREIAKLPPKHFKQVVGKALVLLIEVEPPDSKQLEGYDGLWRSTSANTGSSMRTTTRSCSRHRRQAQRWRGVSLACTENGRLNGDAAPDLC